MPNDDHLPVGPLGTITVWLNVELMKNAAEIGVIRFLYAVRDNGPG